MTDYLLISKINTVVFCPRRYYIEVVLDETQAYPAACLCQEHDKIADDFWEAVRAVYFLAPESLGKTWRVVNEASKHLEEPDFV
jgi:hypothetical protein